MALELAAVVVGVDFGAVVTFCVMYTYGCVLSLCWCRGLPCRLKWLKRRFRFAALSDADVDELEGFASAVASVVPTLIVPGIVGRAHGVGIVGRYVGGRWSRCPSPCVAC